MRTSGNADWAECKDCPAENSLCRGDGSGGRGKIFAVGIGPGDLDYLVPRAREALNQAEIVTGFHTYLKLVEPLLTGKAVIPSGMTREVERCRQAVEWAAAGKRVAMVCGGDPGVYSMAGLLYETAAGRGIEIEVIPGVTAATAAASLLGAPLMHDFAVISLSDLLTPWEVIANRLRAAGQGDFVVVLYNPKSRGRTRQIELAQEILLSYREPDTPVGIVRCALRGDSEVTVTTLEKMLESPVDMFSTVIIGNSRTTVLDGKMVTPRGYEK